MKDSEKIEVYLILNDIDHEAAFKNINNEYPDLVAMQENLNKGESYNITQVHLFKEQKRKFYTEVYSDYNNNFIKFMEIPSEDQIFISRYSPLNILKLTKDEIINMSSAKEVYLLELCEITEPHVCQEIATEVIQADYTRDTKGLDGTDVKIGQIDLSCPDSINSELDGASITSRYSPVYGYTSHATRTAIQMVGETLGIVPDADLYATDIYGNSLRFYSEIEWLIDQGVDVINMSIGLGYDTTYGVNDAWLDHLAINHSVHFVKGISNSALNNPPYLSTPAMSYNSIVVGGFDDNDSTDFNNYTLYPQSSYQETAGYAEKPDIIAPAVDLLIANLGMVSGTSYAAPLVTATIAQMIDYNPALATQQTSMKAILAASAFKKVEHSNYGLPGCSYYDDIKGAGEVDAKNARYIVSDSRYWRGQLYTNQFPYERTFSVSSSSSQIRVALFWLKQNSMSGDHTDDGNLLQAPLSDLDLIVKDPNGNTVASSLMVYNNVEVVEFDPTISGNYTIRVQRCSGSTSYEWVGLAWW